MTCSAIDRPGSRALAALLITLAVPGAAGCGGGNESAAPVACAAGDPTQPLQFDIMYRNLDGELTPALPNSEVPLIAPPQGGQILLVGPRASNLEGCHVELSTALLDTESRVALTVDRRPVALEPNPDGTLTPKNPRGLSGYSNVAACPAAKLTRRVNGMPYELEMAVTDGAGRSAQRSVIVLPTCVPGPAAADCECQCSDEYRQGEPCNG